MPDAILSGFVGAVVGALVGAAVTLVVDERRARREDRFRWASDKRSRYARFLSAADRLREDADLAQIGVTDHVQNVAEAWDTLNRARAEVELMAPAVMPALDELYHPAAQLHLEVIHLRIRPEEVDWASKFEDFIAGREKFIGAARRDLATDRRGWGERLSAWLRLAR